MPEYAQEIILGHLFLRNQQHRQISIVSRTIRGAHTSSIGSLAELAIASFAAAEGQFTLMRIVLLVPLVLELGRRRSDSLAAIAFAFSMVPLT